MENITIGQIISAITGLTIIVGFFVAIFKWYKKNITDRFATIEKRVNIIEQMEKNYRKELQDSKEERFILLEGLLACLDGLKQKGANGTVTETFNKINNYIIKKSHE